MNARLGLDELLAKATRYSDPDSGLIFEVRDLVHELADAVRNLRGTAPVSIARSNLPSVCDGKEQDAFEDFAIKQGMDMSQHPLHWLFLNGETRSAREGWRGALEYCQRAVRAESSVDG